MNRNDRPRAPTRARSVALLMALPALFLAGCDQVGTSNVTFWDIVFSMIVFYFWIMFIWVFISLFADIFRRDDLSGGMKALWIFVLVILPFLGALIYIVSRPKVTASDVQDMARVEAGSKAVASVSTADELAKLQQLRDAGTLSEAEFQALKQKVVG
jgi:Short C-terminal domain/Phospholipase_D-nuclease N-terminal